MERVRAIRAADRVVVATDSAEIWVSVRSADDRSARNRRASLSTQIRSALDSSVSATVVLAMS